MDDAQRIAQLIVQRLEEGHFDEKAGLEEIAEQFELSSRQIRRIVQKELRRPADPAAADTAVAAGQTAPDRDDAADHRGRLRERLLEPAPVQRRVQHALSACRRRAFARKASEGAAAIGREPDVDVATLVSSAVRLEGHSRVSCGPRAQGRRARDRRLVRADRAARRREGLDQGHAVEEETRADGRVHAQPDARAAGAAQPCAGAVRSQRTARPDRETPPQGRASGIVPSQRTPACECPAPSTDSSWACVRFSASR